MRNTTIPLTSARLGAVLSRVTYRVGAAVSAVALTLALASCGVPANDKIRRIDPSMVPSHLLDPSPSPSPWQIPWQIPEQSPSSG